MLVANGVDIDDASDSWYETPSKEDSIFDLDDGWAAALTSLWRSCDLEELVELVDALEGLEASVERADPDEDDEGQELSSFIYEMY